MSLPTPDRLAKAKKLLESLDLNSLTRELVKPSLRERSIREQFLALENSLSLSPAVKMEQPFPLHVTLSSLVAHRNPEDIMCGNLSTQCHGSTYRVLHLFDNLTIIFAAAGLYRSSWVNDGTSKWLKEARSALSLPGPLLINTKWMERPLVPSLRHPGKLREGRSLKFDPRDLLCTFKDFVWAESIRLEKLSICRLGLAQHIRRAGSDAQLQEVCSVPLC